MKHTPVSRISKIPFRFLQEFIVIIVFAGKRTYPDDENEEICSQIFCLDKIVKNETYVE